LISSFFNVAKKLSATALSKQSPLLSIGWAIPAAQAFGPKARLTNWSPDQPGAGSPVGARHLQRVGDKLGPQVIGHCPADGPAAVEILDGNEVEPSLPVRA